MNEIALHIENLSHQYGRRTVLSGINLDVPAGGIHGLLGRNGAGKTTLLNLISASLPPRGGKIEVFGNRLFERAETLKKFCYIRERGMYPPGLRVREAFDFAGRAYPNWDRGFAESLLGKFELDARKKYRQLSRGMESSLGLIIGLASRAELTIYDEPSLGLDAAVREYFYETLTRDVAAHPRTVIVSTHLIDEVHRLFQRVIIMKEGRVLLHEDTEALLGRYAYLTGERAAVEAATAGREVLKREELAGVTAFCAAYGGEPLPEGVQAAPVPLQKLFVYLTEGGAAQ